MYEHALEGAFKIIFLKDESKLEPIAVPTAIVATKYDIFETYDPEKQKIISRTLRFIAHFFGCCLIVSLFDHSYGISNIKKISELNLFIKYSSNKSETTAGRLKTVLNSFLLDGSISR